jgi:hypothetical protein
MAISRQFGKPEVDALKEEYLFFFEFGAHEMVTALGALQIHNPTLLDCLAYKAMADFHSGVRQLEQESPYITAYLCLYVGLKETKIIACTHEDADAILTWFGEASIFGDGGRPKNTPAMVKCLELLLKLSPNRVFFSKPKVDEILDECILVTVWILSCLNAQWHLACGEMLLPVLH